MSEKSVLFHYTSPAGLIGIFHGEAIWATHIAFLSDESEYQHTVDLLLQLVDDKARLFLGNTSDADTNTLLEHEDSRVAFLGFLKAFSGGVLNLDRLNCFVTCFSEDGNLLSQWRSYCPPAGGFSIGFDKEYLQKHAVEQGGNLFPCVYTHDEQRNTLEELLDSGIKSVDGSKNSGDRRIVHNREAAVLWRAVIEKAARFKNLGFSEEKEWRFICRRNKQELLFRERPGMAIPYIQFQLRSFEVEKVFVGPSRNPQQAFYSTGWLLNHKGYTHHRVEHSGIPYKAL